MNETCNLINENKKISTLNIGAAISLLKDGYKVRRSAWDSNHWLRLKIPSKDSDVSWAYIFLFGLGNDKNDSIPWVATQSDILQSDWQIYNEK